MKRILSVITVLFFTFSANASNWTCVGKKLTVVLEETHWGLVLAAELNHEPILGTQVNDEDVHYNMGTEALQNIKKVKIDGRNLEAELSIKDKNFYIANAKTLFYEEKLQCKFNSK